MAVTDIIRGPAKIYAAPVGTALPSPTTVAYGTAWGGSWVDLGTTLAEVAVNYQREDSDIEVEQYLMPVAGYPSKEELMIETTLAEITAAGLLYLFGGAIATTAASTATVALEQLTSGGSLNNRYFAWGIEAPFVDANNNLLPIRILIYRAIAKLNGKMAFAKKTATGVPMQLKAYASTSLAAGSQMWLFQKVTGPKL